MIRTASVNTSWRHKPCNDGLFFRLDVSRFEAQIPDGQGVILLAGSTADEEAPLGVDRHGRQDGHGTEVSSGKRFERRLCVQVPPGDLGDGAGDDAVVARVNANRMDRVRLRPFVALDLCNDGGLLDVELSDEAVG